jgi:hypothetical protein
LAVQFPFGNWAAFFFAKIFRVETRIIGNGTEIFGGRKQEEVMLGLENFSSQKRQAVSLQPDQYLEPKWLRC